ncbi:trifunctional transcriptional regulator/proline dehydrogenase/L-glutamate gamma-semialdehyde dehydrogenase [Herminiimonas sp. KBW02]|uniref:bifunctional proline dehydrogenase/L-glutamate gamma-semialdehyde dehydrogenase PutA n=1 Tax=Herminiimonas sp. KBW02 TaxID=2153363 RepID=UPI000F591526|nr:bifunctional proline dehydrogenase/L-glutamate gamma-semialdehyde dehydrogenase PutA [Herminiimonas sp. KBW02]RQO33396.1 trifunctional transcriptional regulator/proline dehydrogenase/L-glutamate gamma-semialdehyde dehydrogenase [Herminiimonas sp. KBW02]
MATTNDFVTSASATDQDRTVPVIPPFAALAAEVPTTATPLRDAISSAYRLDEVSAVQNLLAQMQSNPALQSASQALAQQLVTAVRAKRSRASGVDALMHEFSLSSEEGIALMCLAEALLRIPDHQTADRLIANKISQGDWQRHLGTSSSLFVNAASWGLLITGKLLHSASADGFGAALTRLINKGGEPLIRKGVDLAMRMLGSQFVAGQSIDEALENGREHEEHGYRYSYDMLGEAAITAADADAYYQSYTAAIHAIGKASGQRGIRTGPGISVKLSALHPRYARAQRTRVMQELLPRLKQLVLLARQYDIGLNIDAEEADRLELSLDLMEALAADAELAGYNGLGYVVQAYQKRCPYVIDYLTDLARRSGTKFMVRLVKGAYWDTEIKRAQVDGLSGYPVYTRKAYTDLSYLVCAQKLLAASDVIYPQFATHNALTFATIYQQAQAMQVTDYEFQCLHGMGETLYDQIVGAEHLNVPCRIYAPVGTHETLLAYLVRRLLENGANSSFVNQIVDDNISIAELLQDPVALAAQFAGQPHPALPLPADLYGTERRNSSGIDLSNEHALRALSASLSAYGKQQWHALPLTGAAIYGAAITIRNPADHSDAVGTVAHANKHDAGQAIEYALAGMATWQAHTAGQRATILLRAADLFQQHTDEFIALAVREAGKTLSNAIGEVREAIDFLRYYSAQAIASEAAPPLGVVACISPWNFPLAIFTGQLSAALAAGNVVLAKPAEQTPLIAFRAVQLLHQAGVPENALLFLPGNGETIGAQLVADARISAVVFTGSTQVAKSIHRKLNLRSIAEARDIPLIAETGGQNAMIVDSSALCEQVVRDVITSAFDSAGQRCSALRVLCLQSDIAGQTLHMLKGAMQELQINHPDRLLTDIGPVIDAEAQGHLRAYIAQNADKKIHELALPETAANGTFVAPCILEIDNIAELKREVFGPVLHVLRYQRDDLPQLVRDINATGFGLTLGIHTRIDETIDYVVRHAHVGNIYVNRNIVGAVVGVQPFGGEGLSGTGPKAGGPFYLKRLQHSSAVNIEKADEEDREEARHIETALAELLTWSIPHKEQTLSQLIVEYIRTSPSGKIIRLQGVTGETNTLRFAARGAVLCVAETTPALLNQLLAVYATGNQVVLLQSTALLVPPDFPAHLRASMTVIEHQHVAKDLRLALLERGQHKADLRTALAEREGAIVQVVTTEFPLPIPLWRLVHERALCVNTTAAGGNASLMTIGT